MDKDGDGTIAFDELKLVLREVDENIADSKVYQVIRFFALDLFFKSRFVTPRWF